MDKRFEKVIEKLESQSSSAFETNEKLEKVFQKVSNAQNDTDEKLIEIKNELDSAIDTFKKDCNKQLEKYTKDIKQIKDSGSSEIDGLTKVSEKIKDSYQSNVGKLIKDIDNKSTEILKIYEELDKIKLIQKSAEESISENSKKQEKVINEFKEEAKRTMADMNLSKLDGQFNSLKKRLSKLEQHAHTHTFGGTKI